MVDFYRNHISHILLHSCRFHPTCSEYAMEALRHYGTIRGSWLSICRLLRCHPWAPGGFDPVLTPSAYKHRS